MKKTSIKKRSGQREKITTFIYVLLLFFVATFICCLCLFSNSTDAKMNSQKIFAISKMERIRSFRTLQSDEIQIVDSIYNKIQDFNPGITASYEENDIKFYLNDMKNIYTKNMHDGRYKIFYQVSNFYSQWFADKKEIWTKRQNISVFTKNLENCEIGLQKKKEELKTTLK